MPKNMKSHRVKEGHFQSPKKRRNAYKMRDDFPSSKASSFTQMMSQYLIIIDLHRQAGKEVISQLKKKLYLY